VILSLVRCEVLLDDITVLIRCCRYEIWFCKCTPLEGFEVASQEATDGIDSVGSSKTEQLDNTSTVVNEASGEVEVVGVLMFCGGSMEKSFLSVLALLMDSWQFISFSTGITTMTGDWSREIRMIHRMGRGIMIALCKVVASFWTGGRGDG
jgi:hypothetical protein